MISKFDCKELPNTHLELTAVGAKLTVTLNVPKDLVPFLSKGKVNHSNKFFVYWCAVEIKKVNKKSVAEAYNMLLQNAMVNVRNAKIRKLEKEKEQIRQRKLFI